MDIYRGDIFYVHKGGKVTGSEQYPERPAVIVSNNIGNSNSSIVEVVFLTSQEKNPLPTHTKVFCNVPSIALCEQINTVSKERLGSFIRACSEKEMAAIDKAIMISLGIDAATKDNLENDEQTKITNIDTYSIKLETERDLYKGLYEQLLHKMIS